MVLNAFTPLVGDTVFISEPGGKERQGRVQSVNEKGLSLDMNGSTMVMTRLRLAELVENHAIRVRPVKATAQANLQESEEVQ